MGFWDVTKRLVQGKPAFENAQPKDDWDDDAPTVDYAEDREAKRTEVQDTSLFDDNGNKQIPVAQVIHTKYTLSGDKIEVWSTIRNQSDRALELDKIMMLGVRHDLRYPLQPGQQREFSVFNGPHPTHDNYKKAELYYKDSLAGDYFRADHLVEYKYETDKTYSPNELKLLLPIYDV